MQKRKGNMALWAVLAIVGLVAVGAASGAISLGPFSAAAGGGGGDAPQAACGDDRSCTVTVDWQNALNESGTETADVTYYIKGDDGNVNKQLTDSTNNDVALQPGEYTFAVVSSSTRNSQLVGTSKGSVGADGIATVMVDAENMDLTLEGTDHGGLEAKAFDNNQNSFLNASVSGAGAYEADGATFQSGTSAIAVGSGGDFSYTLTVRQDTSDEEFADRGAYIGVVADTAKYDEPVIKYDGQRLTDQGTSVLTEEGQKAVGSTYDYVYEVPGTFNDPEAPAQIKHTVDVDGSAISGVNPGASDDIQVDFLAQGRYERVATNNVLATSTHKDDSSFTAIHTIMDFTIDHS